MEIDFVKYGFVKSGSGFCYENEAEFPMKIDVEDDGTLTVYNAADNEYILSQGAIPATNQSITLLLKAFAVKREKK